MSSGNSFSTIRIEGGLLSSSSDYLHQIAAGNGQVPGLSPSAYHLSEGERLSDAISSAWNIMRGRWAVFKDAINRSPQTDHCIGITRDRFLLPLFDQLGYGRLLAAKGTGINAIDYPISHAWGHCPMHLMGWNVSIDKRAAGVAGASQTSPHSLVQQFLNLSEDHLWGFLSNGHLLRVLRDNKTFARQSFIEFDLEAMFDSEIFSDFALLFLLCHESRVEADKPHECFLEQWVQAAARNGTRALEQLRFGVEEAIKEIGQGFLEEPSNTVLLQRLRNGSLSSPEYFRQILRLIYRMLFLFAAEDRGLLHPPQTDKFIQKLYWKYYSLGRIRDLAAMKAGTRHSDLWECLELVFNGLNRGIPDLGLPGLNSFLWSETATEALNGARLSDKRLLSAIRHLAYIKDRNTRARVDYRNLGSEELGGIYEKILELTPSLNVAAGVITFETSSISERSETNSHYTPASLVNCLCDSALEPVIERALKSGDPEKALLDIKVCDPACGSGHFLVAAARRIAKRLAYVRTGELEPSPSEMQRALRDAVGRCVYGVDLNPMAVELCKVSLWFETLEPGKPLSFLEHKIKQGNSLIGATPALIAMGIPDAAFTALEGDDQQFVSALKRTNNRAHKETNLLLFSGEIVWEAFARIKDGLVQIEGLGDESLEDIRRKQMEYEKLLVGDDYRHQKLIADAWCAAFTSKKTKVAGPVLTQEEFCLISEHPDKCPAELRNKIDAETSKFSFFHWHLEFPDVFNCTNEADNPSLGWSGGFDLVLGNPPWDRLELMEKEWFTNRNREVATAGTAVARKRLIATLESESATLFGEFQKAIRKMESLTAFLKFSRRYPLCGAGNMNSYAIFAELDRSLLTVHGRCGIVVPSGISSDDATKRFIQDVIQTKSLISLFDFENKGIFPSVHNSFKFCLLTVGSGVGNLAYEAQFLYFAHSTEDLSDPVKRFTLSAQDIKRLNPNSLTCPIFRNRADAALGKAIYERIPVFIRENDTAGNPWQVRLSRMLHMSDDSHLFRERSVLELDLWEIRGNTFRKNGRNYLPLYEAKMIHHFNHRWASYRGDAFGGSNLKIEDPNACALPRYWAPAEAFSTPADVSWQRPWLFVYRKITNTTNERTVITAIVPRVLIGDSAQVIYPSIGDHRLVASLVANLATFCLDYCARQKIGGTNLTQGHVCQLPVIHPSVYMRHIQWLGQEIVLSDWILPRALELTYIGSDLQGFSSDFGYTGPPFQWDEERRFLLRCELDALFFHLYLGSYEDWASHPKALRETFPGPRDAVSYIMDTFPIVKRRDEQKFGSYRTKDSILAIYDAMAQATRTGQSYKSRLDPPPGDPRVSAHQNYTSTPHADGMGSDKRELAAAKSNQIITPELQNDLEELTVVRPAA